jgi:hypothetical protein
MLRDCTRLSLVSTAIAAVGVPATAVAWVALALIGH